MQTQKEILDDLKRTYKMALIYADVELLTRCLTRASVTLKLTKAQLEHEILLDFIAAGREVLNLTPLAHEFECDCTTCMKAAHERRAKLRTTHGLSFGGV